MINYRAPYKFTSIKTKLRKIRNNNLMKASFVLPTHKEFNPAKQFKC